MLGPIYKLFKSHANYALMWTLRILGPIKFCKGPIRISNGPLKFGKGRSHMRPRMDFHLVLHGEYL